MAKVFSLKCPFCGNTHLEEDEKIVRCLDCGMGKYKTGRK